MAPAAGCCAAVAELPSLAALLAVGSVLVVKPPGLAASEIQAAMTTSGCSVLAKPLTQVTVSLAGGMAAEMALVRLLGQGAPPRSQLHHLRRWCKQQHQRCSPRAEWSSEGDPVVASAAGGPLGPPPHCCRFGETTRCPSRPPGPPAEVMVEGPRRGRLPHLRCIGERDCRCHSRPPGPPPLSHWPPQPLSRQRIAWFPWPLLVGQREQPQLVGQWNQLWALAGQWQQLQP